VIELPESLLGARKEPGRIGLAACGYQCPGCPATRLTDALSLRIVGRIFEAGTSCAPKIPPQSCGSGDRLEAVLKEHRHVRIEFASGELPDSVEEFARLRAMGVRSVATPFFGMEDAHDAKSGVPGSFDRARQALILARQAGLEAVVLSPLSSELRSAAGMDAYAALRTLIRLSWALRARLLWYEPGDAPCIASNRE
jgi:hypothetical protein